MLTGLGDWRSREWHGWDICLRPTQASGPLLHVADMLGGATCGVILAGHSSANLTIWDEICHQMNSRFLSRQHDCSSVSSSSPLDEITRREASIWKFCYISSYICGGCVICQVPASDARPYLRDWEDDCMLGVEGGGAVFWAQLYNQTVINDSRPTGK